MKNVKRRPVRLAGLIVGVLMAIATRLLGDEQANALETWFVLIAPIIAAFITERFTFSADFIREVFRLIPNDGNAGRFAARNDRRLHTRDEDDFPKDRGAITIGEALVIIVVLIVVLWLLLPRLGR